MHIPGFDNSNFYKGQVRDSSLLEKFISENKLVREQVSTPQALNKNGNLGLPLSDLEEEENDPRNPLGWK